MTTLYVDNIAPNLASRVSVPGHVIQVVTGTFGNVNISETTTFTDVTSINITPTSTSSKIIVAFDFQLLYGTASLSNGGGGFRILRDSTVVREPVANSNGPYQIFVNPAGYLRGLFHYSAIDEPTTTSQVTYKMQGRIHQATANNDYLSFNETSNTSETGQIIAMEIAG